MHMQVSSYGRKYRKYNSYKGTIGKISKNRVNRRFNTNIPRQKITTDTTEFKYYQKDKNGVFVNLKVVHKSVEKGSTIN